jgi:hypothetical protein
MSFSELENETLNQAELNEIKMNEIRQPWNKWSLELESMQKCLKYMKLVPVAVVVFDPKFNNEWHLAAYFLKSI